MLIDPNGNTVKNGYLSLKWVRWRNVCQPLVDNNYSNPMKIINHSWKIGHYMEKNDNRRKILGYFYLWLTQNFSKTVKILELKCACLIKKIKAPNRVSSQLF